MDRMPKEYKIAVYILFIGLIYFIVFAYTFYMRFKIVESPVSKYILTISAIIFSIYFFPSILLLLKKEYSLKLLIGITLLNIILNLLISIVMLNFNSLVLFLNNRYKVGTFTPYLFLGVARLTPERIIAIMLIEIPWFIYLIYLLRHKETVKFLKTKDYPLVNTQQYTLGIIILLFITLTVISLIFGL
jgi:hypothetical protein